MSKQKLLIELEVDSAKCFSSNCFKTKNLSSEVLFSPFSCNESVDAKKDVDQRLNLPGGALKLHSIFSYYSYFRFYPEEPLSRD